MSPETAPDVRVTARARSPLAPAAAARLARAVLAAERVRAGTISLTFVGPRRMRSLNRAYLGHDYPTDVIAFSLSADRMTAGPPALTGDIYVCPAVAARNARRLGIRPVEECRRLVVHGVLHALGYDHPAGARRRAGAMWRRQERYLARFSGTAR